MGLTMKDRYARLDTSKLPASYKAEFDEMHSGTDGFTDEELNDVFGDNFNEMYSLVEQKYPQAIKKGGVVTKVKPAKVKVIKPKKTGLEEAFTMAEKERMKVLRKKLSKEDIVFIEDQLFNDEFSADEEMIAHFVKETGMSEAQAKKWVALRDKYLTAPVEKSIDYETRTSLKKEERKEKDNVITLDGKKFNRRDPKNKGKTFYDINGKAWTCKGYSAKLDDCIFEDEDKKQTVGCIKSMYASNPTVKHTKGNMVDECKETLKEAGFTVKEHTAGTKKIKRSAPRPEKVIIKERVEDTFTPIMKELTGSKEKEIENKEVITVLNNIQGAFSKFMNRISNLADDGKLEQLKKIEKLLKELLD